MKIQCSCGAKHEFELTPELATHPVQFVCPACGLDASEFVDGLVRRELGQAAPPPGAPVRIPLVSARPAPRAIPVHASPPPPAARVVASSPAPIAPAEAASRCPRHGEVVVETCRVCSKPICSKCMELFGYVCSPLCKAKANAQGISVPVFQGQKAVIEARQWRRLVRVGWSVGIVVGAVVGFWCWFTFIGSHPKPIFSVRFEQPAYSGQSVICGKANDQIVFLHGDTLARHDMKLKQEIWSCRLLDQKQIQAAVDRETKATKALIDKANDQGWENVPRMLPPDRLAQNIERAEAAELSLYVRGQNVWVASPGKLARYDWDTGKPVQELAVKEGFGELKARGDELLLVDEQGGKTVVTRIDLVSGQTRTEQLAGSELRPLAEHSGTTAGKSGTMAAATVPRTAGLPQGMPGRDMGRAMDPAKVAQQAQRMSLPEKIALPATLSASMNQERTLRELDENRPSDAPEAGLIPGSSLSLVPTKDGCVEFAVKLLEARVVTRSAMKPPSGKPALSGNLTAGNSLEAAGDLLNEMQRDRGGDKVEEDTSRYQATLRRLGSEESWTGEVVGPPRLYPLQTVNVLAANKLMIVFDQSNKKLWKSALSYNIVGGSEALAEGGSPYGQGPCVERKGSLYVFDEGVLTAFDLATGNARWRVPTVGVAGLFFDDRDMIYVNTTTASHERIKYSRQIDISQKDHPLVMKVDSRNGKILWHSEPGGLVSYVSGTVLLVVHSFAPEEEENPYTPDTGLEQLPYLQIRRISARNGEILWEHFQQRAPLDVAIDKNIIRIVFKKEVQVLKFLTF
jgi:hypothetical protein